MRSKQAEIGEPASKIRFLYLSLVGSLRDPKIVLFYDEDITVRKLLFHIHRYIGTLKTITFPKRDDDYSPEDLERAQLETRYVGK